MPGWIQTIPPANEPVNRADAKQHLRVDIPDDDSYIDGLITVARILCETYVGRAFMTQTWAMSLDAYPTVNGDVIGPRIIGTLEAFPSGYSLLLPRAGPISLPLPPCQSVTSIQYLDTAGVTQTLAASQYTVDTVNERTRVVPAYGLYWPLTRPVVNALTITFVAGYGDAPEKVPMPLRHAIKMAVVDLYEQRGSFSMGSLQDLKHFSALKAILDQYRSFQFY